MADIGNITASLKLESAAFIREMTRASQATAKSTSAMQRSFANLDARMAAHGRNIRNTILGFASVAGVRAFVNLGQAAIKSADEIASAARRMGVSAEQLQRFRFAAEQADVSVEELSAAFRIFQKQIASGKFFAEGDNIIEQFQNFIRLIEAAPQTEKFKIAMAGAGKSAGAAMGLAADGAENFTRNMRDAVVISNEMIARGDALDDKMAAVSQAISTGFAEGVLSAFGGELDTSKEKMETLAETTKTAVQSITFSIGLAAVAVKGLVELLTIADANIRAMEGTVGGESSFAKNIPPGTPGAFRGAAAAAAPAAGAAGPTDAAKEAAAAAREAAAAEREWNAARQEGLSLVAQTFSPIEQYNALIERSGQLHLTAAEQARVQQRAQIELADSYINAAAQVSGTLASAFQDNKAFAIANAVMNVAQGITQALTLPFPLNWAQVAAVTAAGVQQIRAISSARPGGGGTGKVGAGKSASGGSGRRASGDDAGVQQNTLFIEIEGEGFLSRQQLDNVMKQLVEAQRDGAKLVLAKQ